MVRARSVTWASVVVAVALAAAGVGFVLFDASVRRLEASTSAAVIAVTGFRSAAIGSAVVFMNQGRAVGYSLTPGCSVALLVAPLMLIVAALLFVRRLSLRRALTTAVVLVALLFTVNQCRFLVIAWSMREWGFRTGYERSHIFLGTIVSTIGVVVGLLLVLRQVTAQRRVANHG